MNIMGSRIEINFNRLLGRCEKMAADGLSSDWRLKSYVECLQHYLGELSTMANAPSNLVLDEYKRKVDLLKSILTAESKPTPLEKAAAARQITVGPSASAADARLAKTIHTRVTQKHQASIREELLGRSGLRQRGGMTDSQDDAALDQALQQHEREQTRIAEEMISLTRDLKTSALIAGDIVRGDVETIEQSSALASSNVDRLKVESDKLEQHAYRTCSCGIWLLLAVVMVTFVAMVLFMRLFRKKIVS